MCVRLGDSVVGGAELADDEEAPSVSHLFSRISTVSTATLRTRSRLSLDIRESLSKARSRALRVTCTRSNRRVYILARGKQTQIPCPFPTRSPSTHAFFWKSSPKCILPCVIHARTGQLANLLPLHSVITELRFKNQR